jgi:hypothetical protein
MKSFFEKINAWFLVLLLFGCGFFIYLYASVSEVLSISLSFLLFLFTFAWLLSKPKKEIVNFFEILAVSALIFISGVAISIVIDKIEPMKKTITSIPELDKLPTEIVKIRVLKHEESHAVSKGDWRSIIPTPSYFVLEVENLSDKYRIEKLKINLIVAKDNVVFYKNVYECEAPAERAERIDAPAPASAWGLHSELVWKNWTET